MNIDRLFVDIAKQIQAQYDHTLNRLIDDDAQLLFKYDQNARRAYKEKRMAWLCQHYKNKILVEVSAMVGQQLAARLYNQCTFPRKGRRDDQV